MTEQRRALVTGASSGIGAAIAARLVREGYAVTGTTREASRLAPPVVALEADLADLDAVARTFDTGFGRAHRFDVVVLAAGEGRFGGLEQFSVEHVRAMVDLNLTSNMLLLRALLPSMKAQRAGRIVFIGSEAALAGKRNGAVYCATKFAVRGFAQALREECAPAGIDVSVVNPGMVDTAFFAELDFAPAPGPDTAIQAGDVADAVAMILAMRPGTVVDEINLSPRKHVVKSKR